MKIQINPQFVECQEGWESKGFGCVFVSNPEHIDPVWKVLCSQDDYWEEHKDLIKVAPKTINSVKDLEQYCQYVGKTDVYDPKAVKNTLKLLGIEIMFFQMYDPYEYQR